MGGQAEIAEMRPTALLLLVGLAAGCSIPNQGTAGVSPQGQASVLAPPQEVPAKLAKLRLQASLDYLLARRTLEYAYRYRERLEQALIRHGCQEFSLRLEVLNNPPPSLGGIRGPSVDWVADSFYETNTAPLYTSLNSLSTTGNVSANDLEDFEKRFQSLRQFEPALEALVTQAYDLAAREGLLARDQLLLSEAQERLGQAMNDYRWRTGEVYPDELARPERQRLEHEYERIQEIERQLSAEVADLKKWQAPQFLATWGDRRALPREAGSIPGPKVFPDGVEPD